MTRFYNVFELCAKADLYIVLPLSNMLDFVNPGFLFMLFFTICAGALLPIELL